MADTPLPSAAIDVDDRLARRRARRATLITVGLLVGLVALVVLLTPLSDNATETRLTTLKYGPGNARLAWDLARRLGWNVRTTGLPLRAPLDTTVIYAVFGGPTAMQPAERAALLSAVRRGAGLLVAPSGTEPFRLLTRLGLRQGEPGLVTATPLGTCPTETDAFSTGSARKLMCCPGYCVVATTASQSAGSSSARSNSMSSSSKGAMVMGWRSAANIAR